jgi:hypothetical protein
MATSKVTSEGDLPHHVKRMGFVAIGGVCGAYELGGIPIIGDWARRTFAIAHGDSFLFGNSADRSGWVFDVVAHCPLRRVRW